MRFFSDRKVTERAVAGVKGFNEACGNIFFAREKRW